MAVRWGRTPVRLLLIEDSARLRDSLARGLRHEGYEVEAAADGLEGWLLARSGHHDVLVLDLMLPGMDGLDLLQRLRAEGRRTPVLVLTARDAVSDRVLGLECGADDYLVKPFAFAELLARLHALERRAYGREDDRLRVGDLEVDLPATAARRGGRLLDLSATEYRVLCCLARRKGIFVSREELCANVYGTGYTPPSNALEVAVSRLRRKLEEPGRPRLLHSRRGRGYCLDAPEGEEGKGT